MTGRPLPPVPASPPSSPDEQDSSAPQPTVAEAVAVPPVPVAGPTDERVATPPPPSFDPPPPPLPVLHRRSSSRDVLQPPVPQTRVPAPEAPPPASQTRCPAPDVSSSPQQQQQHQASPPPIFAPAHISALTVTVVAASVFCLALQIVALWRRSS
ncbi:uncharacterized protein LOC125759910 [Rhipicephalus sanguineus]|uniref:uncharacterized protein LOC125759910 n=1 Tax=Rhipicephalus sanguineus TaxID=34632 RepID=UPI0020C25C00|nr:uncharacterized protein LOC125759910 [Rhipicephalus sanguineus]